MNSALREQLVNLVMVIFEQGTSLEEVVAEVSDAKDDVEASRKHPDSQADGFRE